MADQLISDEHLDAVLAASDPLSPEGFDTQAVAQALTELRSSTFASETRHRPRVPGRVRRAHPRRPLTIGLAVVVIAVAVSLVGLSGSSRHSTGSSWLMTVTPAQAAQLDHIADATAQQSAPGNGQWLYQRYETSVRGYLSWTDALVRYHRTSVTQQWTSSRVQRFRVDETQFGFNTPKDRATFLKHRSHLLGELTDSGPLKPGSVADSASPILASTATFPPRYTPQDFPDTKLGVLTRFKQLVAAEDGRLPKSRFRAQFKAQLAGGLFGVITMILEKSVSERQRAAAFKALAYVSNVQVLGNRTDVRGRTGVAIRVVPGNSIETLIVDPRTGSLLQDTEDDYGAGDRLTVIRTVYLQRAVVGSMTAAPDGRSVPFHGPRPKLAKGTPGK
jgi:hypothetical protein